MHLLCGRDACVTARRRGWGAGTEFVVMVTILIGVAVIALIWNFREDIRRYIDKLY
jgi:hypothetical protein